MLSEMRAVNRVELPSFIHAVAQIDAMFEIDLHCEKHLRPAHAIAIGRFEALGCCMPAFLSDGDEGAPIGKPRVSFAPVFQRLTAAR